MKNNWSNKIKYINTRTLHKAMDYKRTIKEPLTRPIDLKKKNLFDLKNEKKVEKILIKNITENELIYRMNI